MPPAPGPSEDRTAVPALRQYIQTHIDEALEKAKRLVADGGYGHTASLYVHPAETEKIAKHAEAMKTCRILINTPSSHAESEISTTLNWHRH